MVACAANYQPLRMMECLGCEMEVVCGQEGPMTELTIIHVATHTLFLGSNCTRSQERPGHRTTYMSILYLTCVELHVSTIPCCGLLSIHTYSKSAREHSVSFSPVVYSMAYINHSTSIVQMYLVCMVLCRAPTIPVGQRTPPPAPPTGH